MAKSSYEKQTFVASIIFTLIAPLLPILAELIINKEILLPSLTMSAAMYALSVGITSNRVDNLAWGITAGFLQAFTYGSIVGEETEIMSIEGGFALLVIIGMFVVHYRERRVRHLVDKEDFSPLFSRYLIKKPDSLTGVKAQSGKK